MIPKNLNVVVMDFSLIHQIKIKLHLVILLKFLTKKIIQVLVVVVVLIYLNHNIRLTFLMDQVRDFISLSLHKLQKFSYNTNLSETQIPV